MIFFVEYQLSNDMNLFKTSKTKKNYIDVYTMLQKMFVIVSLTPSWRCIKKVFLLKNLAVDEFKDFELNWLTVVTKWLIVQVVEVSRLALVELGVAAKSENTLVD